VGVLVAVGWSVVVLAVSESNSNLSTNSKQSALKSEMKDKLVDLLFILFQIFWQSQVLKTNLHSGTHAEVDEVQLKTLFIFWIPG
jgi:divalent metal cation (Fe/Co/Zn/Cd) transporter